MLYFPRPHEGRVFSFGGGKFLFAPDADKEGALAFGEHAVFEVIARVLFKAIDLRAGGIRSLRVVALKQKAALRR